jgi:hypothetical protein
MRRRYAVQGTHLGGVMASFGFAEKAGVPRSYRKDDTRRLYIIEPGVAAAVLAALGAGRRASSVGMGRGLANHAGQSPVRTGADCRASE